MNEVFYFCDLIRNNKTCQRQETCKRYTRIKDIDKSKYDEIGVAKLYNICQPNGEYKLYLKEDEAINNEGTNKE